MLFVFLQIYPIPVFSQVTCQEPPLRAFNISVVSDSFTKILGADMSSIGQAVNCWVNPGWSASVPGATWIWESYKYSYDYKIIKFQVQFYVPGVPFAGNLRIASDDDHTMTLNGQDIGCNGSGYWAGSEKDCNVLPYLVTGLNTAIFSAINYGGPGALIFRFDLKTMA